MRWRRNGCEGGRSVGLVLLSGAFRQGVGGGWVLIACRGGGRRRRGRERGEGWEEEEREWDEGKRDKERGRRGRCEEVEAEEARERGN